MKNLLGVLVLLLPFSAMANVAFYGQCDYQGPAVELGVGDYTAEDLGRLGIPEDAIAAVKVPKGFVVTLHENDKFSGRYGTLKKSDSCLDNNGFSNLVSSLSIKSTAGSSFGATANDPFGATTLKPTKPALSTGPMVEIFTECRFSGKSAKLAVGDYNLAQLRKNGFGNNDISSVKVPKGLSITVYDFDFLRGESASSGKDVSCIDSGSFANRITSVSVQKNGATNAAVAAPTAAVATGASVYTECNYEGRSAKLSEGQYTSAQLRKLGIADNAISSMQVAPGYEMQLYINDFQRGTSGSLDTDNPCLVGRYNDSISSIEVRKKQKAAAKTPVATLYLHCNYRGGSVELPAGRYDTKALEGLLVANNSVSSIKLMEGYKATIFDGDRFKSKKLSLSADDDCLDNDDMNEKLSSIIIESESQQSNVSSGGFIAQPAQSNTAKSDDLIAALTCVQEFVEKDVCNAERWKVMERRCNLSSVDELSDGYLEGHVNAGNCRADLWDELVRRTANPHLR